MPLAELEQKLGSVALRLLKSWWSFRSWRTGETWAPLSTAALGAGLTIYQARRAAKRLREAGLVQAIREEIRPGGFRRFHRHVRGVYDQPPWLHEPYVNVPAATRAWLRTAPDACDWGGRRRDAGRRRVIARLDPSGARAPVKHLPRRERLKQPPLVYKKEPGGGGFSVGAEYADVHDEVRANEYALETARRAAVAEQLIPCPTYYQLGAPVTPFPPYVQPDDSPVHRARMLATAYRGAVKLGLRTECYPFSRGAITSSKHYKRLVAAAEVLHELKIRPAAWALWSVLIWKSYRHERERVAGKRLTVPPVAFVFSAARMRKHLSWFNAETGDFLGGHLCHGPLGTYFAKRRQQAISEIIIGEHDSATIIDRVFPEGYANAVEAVRKQNTRIVAELKARRDDGEWIWTWI